MSQSTIISDLYVQGNLAPTSFTPPAGCITDAAVQQNTNIQATKVIHTLPIRFNSTGTVANQTMPIYLVNSSLGATIFNVKLTMLVVPTGSDSVICDIQRSTGGGAFATVLTSPVTFNVSSTAKSVITASLTTTALVQNDLLVLVVTGTNTSGSGLLGIANIREAAQ